MTSNIGSEHFRKLTNPVGFPSRGIGVEQVQGDIRRELERRVLPEFLNRIDEVVLFAPLTHDETREIAKHYLAQVRLVLNRSERRSRSRPLAGRAPFSCERHSTAHHTTAKTATNPSGAATSSRAPTHAPMSTQRSRCSRLTPASYGDPSAHNRWPTGNRPRPTSVTRRTGNLCST
jgi:hypothetical protein